jgi:hypothetical protein
LGTIAGMKALEVFLKKYKRQSPIVILLTALLGLSAFMIPIFGIIEQSNKPGAFIQWPAANATCIMRP